MPVLSLYDDASGVLSDAVADQRSDDMKKLILVIAVALHLLAATPTMRAEIDVPGCFPCGR